jgi:hypothetical protein
MGMVVMGMVVVGWVAEEMVVVVGMGMEEEGGMGMVVMEMVVVVVMGMVVEGWVAGGMVEGVGMGMVVEGWVALEMGVVVRRSLAPEVVGMPGSAGCRWGSTGGCCSPPRSS